MKQYPLIVTSLAPDSVPRRRQGPPPSKTLGPRAEWKPTTPRERAAALALGQLWALVRHLQQILSPEYDGLDGILHWMDNFEAELEGIQIAIHTGDLVVGMVRPGDEHWDGMNDLLSNCPIDVYVDNEDEVADFARSIVEYWLHDVLRDQCIEFLSVLNGSIGALEVIESFEHLGHVRYPR